MSMSTSLFFFSFLFLGFISISSSHSTTSTTANCPLDFTILSRLRQASRNSKNHITQCVSILQGIRLVQSEYLLRTNTFLISTAFSQACWQSLQSVFDKYPKHFDIQYTCDFHEHFITQGCHNITTKAQYEAKNSRSALKNVEKACKHSAYNSKSCALCNSYISRLEPSGTYKVPPSDIMMGRNISYKSECVGYKSIYAAAFDTLSGPTDPHNAKCFFDLTFDRSKPNQKLRKTMISVFSASGFLILVIAFVGFWWMWRNKLKNNVLVSNLSHLDSIGGNNALIKFSFGEVEKATKNFSTENIIGRGGYGNVYKGVLPDRTQVALKRFKNCSAAGNASFAHEVGIIASVRHVNLVALRGYCIAKTKSEGHQRIIVCDLMKNGSLHDHLFGPAEKRLSWPIRQKIALGTARGLAYLHDGAQPSIIHRDIKASNILLDDEFEPKLADFGLAKIAPEGVSHVSTHVAGTMGYVAPEYALYGKLTERSDVYSFGIVLLELLSGKKALLKDGDDKHTLLADWAWSLVKVGRTLDIVEEGTPELGPLEIMEKYVLLAVLCSHPQLYARPTMDQVVKILDSNYPVPVIPERPNPFTTNVDGTETSISSLGSSCMSSYSTY
ncbi:putative LRR receptor-like serine/threonine-protein kinase RKF3 [Heracleum sosnowskyi]|uniref:non-specific serine/threonine protein kinase n=1 Tax=Heracleum sosnowskyi TaxID=360622 RepID=A0AAD8GPE9_9APIA|nr:putative LRR receptor-like serine/threonine-protein kinase RKF3 [Heracleum sosnowskyi]